MHPLSPRLTCALSQFNEEACLTKSRQVSFKMAGKTVDSSWQVLGGNGKFALAKGTSSSIGGCYASKISHGFGSQVLAAMMTFLMGIVAMVRLTRSMPKKLTDSTFYSSTVCDGDSMMKGQSSSQPVISAPDLMPVVKRMAELEERMRVLNMKPTTVPAPKEEMLNAALGRVSALEHELMATKQALQESLTRQEDLLGGLDKKKKKKKWDKLKKKLLFW